VHAYLFDDQTGTGAFLQRTVQGTKDCWNWSIVHEFSDKPGNPATNQIAAALRRDRDGLAVATMTSAGSTARVVPVDGIQPTTQTLIDGSYPFGRGIYLYIDPATLKNDKVVNFLRFCLSQDGQKMLAAQGDFLPLDAATAANELTKLQ
jgi:phosphate transport system substrate-binding protein